MILLESTRNPSGSAWGLACFSFEADVVAIVQAADEPFNLFGDSSRCFIQRPLIGIITKTEFPLRQYPHGKAVADQRGMREDLSGE